MPYSFVAKRPIGILSNIISTNISRCHFHASSRMAASGTVSTSNSESHYCHGLNHFFLEGYSSEMSASGRLGPVWYRKINSSKATFCRIPRHLWVFSFEKVTPPPYAHSWIYLFNGLYRYDSCSKG